MNYHMAPKGEADRPRRQVPSSKVWVTDDEGRIKPPSGFVQIAVRSVPAGGRAEPANKVTGRFGGVARTGEAEWRP